MKCEMFFFKLIHFIWLNMNGFWELNFRSLQNSINVNAVKLIWLNAVCNFQNLFFIFDVFFWKFDESIFVMKFNITNWSIWKKINLICSSILAVDETSGLSLNEKNQSIFVFWFICLQMVFWLFKIIKN